MGRRSVYMCAETCIRNFGMITILTMFAERGLSLLMYMHDS